MKKGVIHQPHFFPWLGYFNKLCNSDIFIILDDVQYRTSYYQNRTIIQNRNTNKSSWLTLPVEHSSKTLIQNATISERKSSWKTHLLKTIYHNYKKSPYFNSYYDELNLLISSIETHNLVDINVIFIAYLLEKFEINLKTNFESKHLTFFESKKKFNHEISIYKSSDFEKQETATKKLVYLCQETDIKYYIFGEGGSIKYHGINNFRANEIYTLQQKFIDKAKNDPEYRLHSSDILNFSALEYLFYRDINWIKEFLKEDTLICATTKD